MSRVLVLRKSTNLEIHGDRVRQNIEQGVISATKLDNLQRAHDQHYETLDLLHAGLSRAGFSFDELVRDKAHSWSGEYTWVLTVGGDGTLLNASHTVEDTTKLIGIRSSDASVGYLCAAGRAEIDTLIDQLADESLEFVNVTRMRAQVTSADTGRVTDSVPVLNDILFANAHPASTTRYRISLGDAGETHKSSGLWMATPVGSTAAISAAGGVRQRIEERSMQFRVRELHRPHEEPFELSGGFFDPDEQVFGIENRNEQALICLDGQHGEMSLRLGDRFVVCRGPDLCLARPQSASKNP